MRAALAYALALSVGLAIVAPTLSRAQTESEARESPDATTASGADDEAIAQEPGDAPPPDDEAAAEAPSEAAPPPPTTTAPTPAAPAPREPPSPEAAPAAEPPPSVLETSTLLVSLGIFVGSPQQGELDIALGNFGYSPSDTFWGFDVSVERRLTRVLWLGARGDFRMRQWTMVGGASADAFGPSLLVVLDLRLPLSRVLDIAAVAGGGFGAAIVRVREKADIAGLPRLHGGLQLGVTIVDGFRVHVGAAFDYAESLSLNDYGYGVSFGVAAFRFGFEGRL